MDKENDSLGRIFMWMIILLIIFVIGIQAGIYKGRILEKENNEILFESLREIRSECR